jgi:hypothetical protein
MLVDKPHVFDVLSYFLGHMEGPVFGCIGQDNNEFFTSVSGTEIPGPIQGLCYLLSGFPQTDVPLVMAIIVVIALEIVDITHDQSNGSLFSSGPQEFPADVLREAAPIMNSSQSVVLVLPLNGCIGCIQFSPGKPESKKTTCTQAQMGEQQGRKQSRGGERKGYAQSTQDIAFRVSLPGMTRKAGFFGFKWSHIEEHFFAVLLRPHPNRLPFVLERPQGFPLLF